MPRKDYLYNHHMVSAFVPKADAFLGGIDTDYVSLANYRRATLIIHTGAIEDTAISNLVTFNASDDNSGSNRTAMAWVRRFSASSATVDLWETLTAVAAAGYNFANRSDASADDIWVGEVTADEVEAAQADAQFVNATIAETVDKTITASGMWHLSEPRFVQDIPVTAII